MTEPQRAEVLRRIAEFKAWLHATEGFIQDAEARDVYVALCTLEGAVMFGDLRALGELCARFCKDKADEVARNN